jgi:hypothetical protein
LAIRALHKLVRQPREQILEGLGRLKMYQDDGKTELLLGLLIGAAAGLAIGLLLAPKPGSETREMVKQSVTQGMERLRQLRSQVS